MNTAKPCIACVTGHSVAARKIYHRNFGPENLGPGGPKFPTDFGSPSPILPEINVRVGNIGQLTAVYMYIPKFPAVSSGNNGLP